MMQPDFIGQTVTNWSKFVQIMMQPDFIGQTSQSHAFDKRCVSNLGPLSVLTKSFIGKKCMIVYVVKDGHGGSL